MGQLQVSIVICTHRRLDLLAGAVQSLVDQTASPDRYEVIVVDNDNAPTEVAEAVVRQASQQIAIRYVHESRIGLSHARNTGGQAARAQYIGYLDDDAKAPPHYVATLLRDLAEQTPDICGGPYYPFYLQPKPAWFQDVYGTGTTQDNVARFMKHNEFLSGMNIVFRRGLLDELHWFDPHLGMVGRKMWYGEETMVQIKAWNAYPHLKVYYDPGLFVYHLVPTRKMSLWNHARMIYQMGYSQVYFWMPEAERLLARLSAPLYLVTTVLRLVFKGLPGVLFRDRRRYPFWQNYVFEDLSRYAGTMGQQLRLAKDLLLVAGKSLKDRAAFRSAEFGPQ